MYEYIWDDQTGGILLTTNQSKFSNFLSKLREISQLQIQIFLMKKSIPFQLERMNYLTGFFIFYCLAVKRLRAHITSLSSFFYCDFPCPPVFVHLIKVFWNW